MRIILKTAEKVVNQEGLFVDPVFKSNKDVYAGFSGKFKQTYFCHNLKQPEVSIGAGSIKNFSAEKMRELGAISIKESRRLKAKKVFFKLDFILKPEFENKGLIQALAEGLFLGDYSFLKYKEKAKKKYQEEAIKEICLVLPEDSVSVSGQRYMRSAIKFATKVSEAVYLSRDLVNEPAGFMKPGEVVKVARQIVRSNPDIKLKVLSDKELKANKFGGLLAVSKGSDEPAYMIEMRYEPKDAKQKVALVGKGLTFDSGGLSLKPSESMESMKVDMSGAAAVLGVFSAVAETKPKVALYGIMGICENMPSGKAIKPGDIITSYNKKTIEVRNTDAEGRIVLADLLSYTESKIKPDIIVDLATLTGACMGALGEQIAGVFSPDKQLIKRITKASKFTGEKVWNLPLPSFYNNLIKSPIADISNISNRRYGGAITAALFLKSFVKSKSWAHIDIAGPAREETNSLVYIPKGGTGYGVRLLIEFIDNL